MRPPFGFATLMNGDRRQEAAHILYGLTGFLFRVQITTRR
jgi:hypothetical protein